MSWFRFRPYVSVAERRNNAQREVAKLQKRGKVISPVALAGRAIAHTFWGKAWCENLESYMDYANRLPRGRTYVRNGSVVHLDVRAGEIEALVSGSELYRVEVKIQPASRARWKAVCRECSGGIGSLVELLQGRFSDRVMDILTRKETGLFPAPKEIKLKCSCPDWATLCKHVAAVLYGVGARLDQQPELLFVLRSVDADELITQAAGVTDLTARTAAGGPELAEADLGEVFGIDLEAKPAPAKSQSVSAAKAVGVPKPKATSKPKAKVPTRGKGQPVKSTKTIVEKVRTAAKRRWVSARAVVRGAKKPAS
jgi:uncharacterized Zn finger protein